MRAILIVLICIAGPVSAETSDDARTALADTLSALKESGRREKEMEAKHAVLERERRHLQEEMVTLAGDTASREQELSDFEDKLTILEGQKKEKTDALQGRQQELSALLSAMMKIRQMPPEAVIAMPGKLDETLAAARALQLVSHAVEEESTSLRAQLHELDALEEKIRRSRETIAARTQALQSRQTELKSRIAERSHIQETLGGREREEKERAAKLQAKSQNLQELLDSLEKSERVSRQKEAHALHKNEHLSGHKTLRSLEGAQGRLRLPAGKTLSRYGNTALGAEFSKGIVTRMRPGSSVLAPYDGEVVFAGNFRGYGHMVILRHGGDYHTLLSGMDQVNCSPGQFIAEGEPVGTMGDGGDARRLYLELRKSGKAVDPAAWFKG